MKPLHTGNLDGYIMERLGVGEQHQRQHRRIASEKVGRPLTKGEIVHHIDEDRSNNDQNNLEVLTHKQHKQVHFGGEKSHLAIFTDQQIFDMLDLVLAGKRSKDVAKQYGISEQTLCSIRMGRRRVVTFEAWKKARNITTPTLPIYTSSK
jgi:DNA-binding Xre family transcriptional regulator